MDWFDFHAVLWTAGVFISPMTRVLKKEKWKKIWAKDTKNKVTWKQRQSLEWCSSSQGRSMGPQKLEEAVKASSLEPTEPTALLSPWFWTFGLQNWENNLYCFWASEYVVICSMAALGSQYSQKAISSLLNYKHQEADYWDCCMTSNLGITDKLDGWFSATCTHTWVQG